MLAAPAHRSAGPWSLFLRDGFRLLEGDRAVAVPSRERRVLAALALQGRRPRAHLSGLLWPDSEERRAQGSLRAAIWRIQQVAHGLLTEEDGLLGLVPDVEVDVHELRNLAHRVANREPLEDAERALEVLGCGPLLPGWYDDWVLDQRAQLQQQQLRCLETLAKGFIEEGRLDAALQAAMTAATLEPLRESAHRTLIRVHLEDGNHVEAVLVYQEFSQRLRRELGIAASPRMTELVRPLLEDPQEPPPRVRRVTTAHLRGARGRSPGAR
jgi:DNA-binding SARP family transcriptional activator